MIINVKKGLTNKEFGELKRVIEDIFFFSEFIYVRHPVRGKTQFKLYPYQKRVLWYFLTKRFNLIKKFRQAGLTELISMFALWLAMYFPDKNIQIISIKDRVAKRVLGKIKYMYRNLPDHLKTPIVNGRGSEVGTACVTPDTPLIGEYKTFPMGEICPAIEGILDVTNLNLRILTHNGTFERVTKTINKGILETWEIENDRGKVMKCTPGHRLYTTKGWKTVREIIEKGLAVIFWDTHYLDNIKASHYSRGIPGDNIYVSGIKVNRVFNSMIVDLEVENYHSYITPSHYISHNTEMEFSNGSIITSIPTTEDAGRSEALTLMIIDEAAIVRWASKIWAAAFPTLSTGGSAIVNSCVTGDTEIVGKNGTFRIDAVCPREFGAQDIRFMGLEVLSHTGKWQRVLGSVNKGRLETWEIDNKFGNTLKCTPAHKLLTPSGWHSVKHIIENNLNAIFYDTGITSLEEPPITIPPKLEVLKTIPGFSNYQISNLGKVFIAKNGKIIEKEGSVNSRGYRSISLWDKGIKKKFILSNLVALSFIGYIPDGYIVDHIDCNTLHDYVTNLQIITISENGRRAAKFSRGMKIGCKIGKGFPNLQLIGKIKEKSFTKYPDQIIKECHNELGVNITRAFISRIINKRRTNTVQISKLTLVKKYVDTIYDISVEEDQSYICNSLYINHNTPYGVGNWYHSQWVDSLAGGNEFNAIDLKWDMHPERDIAWYNTMRSSLGPRRTAQEIDGDFLSSGDSVFNLIDIKAIEDDLSENPPIETKLGGNLLIFKKAEMGVQYFIGADISTGRSRDYSAFSIMDKWGDEVGCFKGKIPPNRFADLLMKVGKDYNTALLAPEANDIGLATVSRIQDEGYPELYYTTQILKEKGTSRPKTEKVPGWLTTKKNRPVIIDELETDIRQDNVSIKNPFFVSEAYTFIYGADNKPIAMGKNAKRGSQDDVDLDSDSESYTDDSVLSEAITNHIRKRGRSSVIIAPSPK